MITPTVIDRPALGADSLPLTIATLLETLAWRNPFVVLGGLGCRLRSLQFRHPNHSTEEECRSTTDDWDSEAGRPSYDSGISFSVNGGPERLWRMAVVLAPDDTYTVWMWGQEEGLMACERGVYAESLRGFLRRVYDEALRKHFGGNLP